MTVETAASANQPSAESDKEYNFAKLRKLVDQERELRIQAEQEKLEAQERAAQLEKYRQSTASSDEDDDYDEPYVDQKKLKKTLQSFKTSIQEEIRQEAKVEAMALIEAERRTQYLKENADFDAVMDKNIIQKFVDRHGKLASNILNMPEGFDRQKLVYETIKTLGIDKPDQEKSSIQEKIDANRKGPFYRPTSGGTPPYATAGNFSEAGKKDAYAQMKELQKRLHG